MRAILFAVLAIGCVSQPVRAIDFPPSLPVTVLRPVPASDAGRVETIWSARDGVPTSLSSFAANSDGILVAANMHRIYRFDGAQFAEVKDAKGSPLFVDSMIARAHADRAGNVWFGTKRGEVVRVGRASVERFGPSQGLPADTPVDGVIAKDGRVIAYTKKGLYQLHGARWLAVGPAALAGKDVWGLAFDGSLWWALVDTQLVALTRDMRSFRRVSAVDADAYSGLTGNEAGGVWYWQLSGNRNLCRLEQAITCYQAEVVLQPQMSPDGVLWWSNFKGAVLGFDTGLHTGRARRGFVTTIETGTGVAELAVGEDGTLWGKGSRSLIRLAKSSIEKIPVPPGAAAPAPGGKAWIASFEFGISLVGAPAFGKKLFREENGQIRTWPWPSAADRISRELSAAEAAMETRPITLSATTGGLSSVVRIDVARNGIALAATATPATLWWTQSGAWTRHSALPLTRDKMVRGIAQDSKGTVYVAAMRDPSGLYAFDGARWQPMPWRSKGAADDIHAMHIDRHDRIWIGHRSSMTLIENGKIRKYDERDGLTTGPVRAFAEAEGQLWVAGLSGLARFSGDRFEALRLDPRTTVSDITGFTLDDAGAIWIGAAQGIVHVPRAEWASAIGHPDRVARFMMLNEFEGVNHAIVYSGPLPTVTRMTDGSVWFFTEGGNLRIDPRRVRKARNAPPLIIDAVTADGLNLEPSPRLRIPAGTRQIGVAFRALAPVVEGQTTFRYRVAGIDGKWTHVVGRNLILDRLPPGTYSLELQASAPDGTWTGAPTRQSFSMPPTFWQSVWALILLGALLCVVTALIIVWLMKRRAAKQQALELAKVRERERIARDIHDTLLQGVNGLMMTMQAVLVQLDRASPLRQRLESTIDMAGRILIEGRDRVSVLRSTSSVALDLIRELQVYARDLSRERAISCEVEVDGESKELDPTVQDEAVQIGREALSNAFQHSQATQINLLIVFNEDELKVEVRDDGIGLPEQENIDPKHWGIHGMKERAAAIGGTLKVANGPDGGARIVLRVPAAAAYRPSRGGRVSSKWLAILRP